jgi:hypothetical protein
VEIMAILPVTVPRLTELTERLTDAQLHAAPAPDSWSVNDVLAHLRACQDVLGGAMQRILVEDRPSWRAESPRTWQRKSGYHAWSFHDAFQAFATGRRELLATLESLPVEAWQRSASVTVPPKAIYERTVQYYADWLASHERTHLNGLPRIIAAVG